jgi:predicted alpha-1,2-mannosidase
VTDAKAYAKRETELKLDHGREWGQAGYYGVQMKSQFIQAELSATQHCGVHRYVRMSRKRDIRFLIDATSSLFNGSAGDSSEIRFDPKELSFSGSTLLEGQFSSRYGGLRAYYFAKISRAPDTEMLWNGKSWLAKDVLTTKGNQIGLGMTFSKDVDSVELELCLSYVSDAGARENFEKEVAGKSFSQVRDETVAEWQTALARADIQSSDTALKRVYYTSLYHSMLMPTNFTDVSGAYLGFDKKIHEADGFVYRTDLSLWDTFRTTHPLFTLIAPEIQRDSLQSLLEMAKTLGELPRWPSGAGETGSMFGSPANFLFSESYAKGVMGLGAAEAKTALAWMVQSAKEALPGSQSGRDPTCLTHGYCPSDKTSGSVSKTLEEAWADGATAVLAGALGETEIQSEFEFRAHQYRELWDPSARFFRPKDSTGNFVSFSPNVTSYIGFLGHHANAYVEGGPWHWRFTAPHEPQDLIALFGGAEPFTRELESFLKGATQHRSSIYPGSKYWHGNEHDLHAIYLFNEAGHPELTQKWARWAMSTRYADSADGLDGNDDGGALSSWFVFSALGLYPQAGTDRYWIGSPMVDSAVLDLGSGHILKIDVRNQSSKNTYIQMAVINGKLLCSPVVRHSDLVDGNLIFIMGSHAAPGGGFRCSS